MSVSDKDMGYARILRGLRELNGSSVVVGVLKSAGANDGVAIAQYAAWNEFGTRNAAGAEAIPSRPFMRIAFDDNIPEINWLLSKAGEKITSRQFTAQSIYRVIGNGHVKKIKSVISKGDINPPLKPSTVRRKHHALTLVDTGALKNSINWEVRK